MKKAQYCQKMLFAILGLFTVFTLATAIIRIFYGIEISDEAFVISESALVNKGATPFVNNWTQTSGFVLLARLPTLVWHIFKADNEGIFLFYRISFLLFKILILGLCFFLLIKSHVNKLVSYIFALVLLPFYLYVPNFHYNNISIFMLLLIGCIFIYNNDKRGTCAFWLQCVSGCLMALSIYMHPSDFMAYVILLVSVVICNPASGRRKAICRICVSGVLTAVVVTLWMVARGGGIANLLYGLDSVLNYNAYFKLPKNSFWTVATSLFGFAKRFLYILMGVFILKCFWNKVSRQTKCSNEIAAAAFLIISFFYVFFRFSADYIVNACGMIISIYLLCRMKNAIFSQILFPMYLFIFVPQLFSCISQGYFSYSSPASRCGYMLPCIVVVLEDLYENFHLTFFRNVGSFICALIVSLLICKSNYCYIYREEPIPNLTCCVESGIYKGIYTTAAKKELYEELEKYLHSVIDKNKTVLFMEVVPMAYLMTDAQYCAPSTWDIMLYSYGFNDDTIMQRYFEMTDSQPYYIVYIDTGRDDCLSIEKEDYQFTQFVTDNYEKQSELTLGESLDVLIFSIRQNEN